MVVSLHGRLSKLWSLFGSPKLGPVIGPVLIETHKGTIILTIPYRGGTPIQTPKNLRFRACGKAIHMSHGLNALKGVILLMDACTT